MPTEKKSRGWKGDNERHRLVSSGARTRKSFLIDSSDIFEPPTLPDMSGVQEIKQKLDTIDKKLSQAGTGTQFDNFENDIEELGRSEPPVYKYKNTVAKIKGLNNEYHLPVYDDLPDDPKFDIDREYYVRDEDLEFNDLKINDMFSVMDVLVDAYTGTDVGQVEELIKKNKIKDAIKLYSKGRPRNILLVGPTGTGKTTVAKYLAKVTNQPFVRIPLSKITVDDLLGHYDIQGGRTVWIDGLLTKAVRRGWVALLDEVNAAKPDVLFALHTLTDDDRALYLLPKSEIVWAHSQFKLIAAMNVGEAYSGTSTMNAAFLDRFTMIPVNYLNTDDERKIVSKKLGIPTMSEVDKNPQKYTPDQIMSAYALELILAVAEHTRELKFGSNKNIYGSGIVIDKESFVPISTRRVVEWADYLKHYFKVIVNENKLNKIASTKVTLTDENPNVTDKNNLGDIVLNVVKASIQFAIEPHMTDEDVSTVLISQIDTALSHGKAKEIKDSYGEMMKEVGKQILKSG